MLDTLLIKNGRIIDPATDRDEIGDILIEGGNISTIETDISIQDQSIPVFDASDCIVCPGLIDPHVHLREPGGEESETIASGATAAVNGGFTTVCCMPNTNPTIDHAALVKFIYRQSKEARKARVFPVGAVTMGRKGEGLAEMGLMKAAGAVAFSDDGDCVASASLMRKALQFIEMTGKVMMQHCQEPTIATSSSVMNAGTKATQLGLVGWPALAEVMIIERDIRLNRGINCPYHVQHVSCAESVDLIRAAQADGQPVTAEAAPHHLLLTEEACDGYNSLAKVNPPLRTPNDIKAIRAGIADGTITILATDHAPHTRESKSLEFDAAPFGMVGIEIALPLYTKALIESGILDWPQMLAMMTINPAKLCRLDDVHQLGYLGIGTTGDITIIDPTQQWTIDSSKFVGKSVNTPFDGWDVTGRAVATIMGGRVELDRDSRCTRLVHNSVTTC